MTLKKKILMGYGITFALMGLAVIWAITNLASLGKATGAILGENYRSIIAAEKMVDALERQDSGMLLMFLDDTERGITQFRENEAIFLEWLTHAKDNITIQDEAKLVKAIEADYATYRKQFALLTDFRNTASVALKPTYYHETVYPVFTIVRKLCIDLRDFKEKTMYSASVRANNMARYAMWSTAFGAVSALTLALIFSLLLAERIVRPIRCFMEASRKVSSGDYTVQVNVETSDELGHLGIEFNQMVYQLGRYHEMDIDRIIAQKNKDEAILSSIEDGLLVFDTTLKVNSINPAARRLLNVEFSEDSILYCQDILSGHQVCDLVRKTIETGAQPDLPDEQRIIALLSGENPRHYLFSITVIRGRDHNLSGVVLLLRDVTRLKEVERLKSEFIMAASHELRTPLTSLGMSVDLLLEHVAPGLDKKDQDLLQVAHEEVNHMKALVSDLLNLSKMEAGKIELKFESVPVRTLFDQVEAIFKGQTDMKGISLASELTADLPEVSADVHKIILVLTNLISNALRYVSKDGHISLTACRIGSHVHLSVHDDGSGIPVKYQSRIFQKFVHFKGQKTDGTGLGLAICQEIVRAHGGTIWVESSAGQGSTFTFTVPICPHLKPHRKLA
jgi:two-component system, NtrC family, sensor histidine kinase KinB